MLQVLVLFVSNLLHWTSEFESYSIGNFGEFKS